MKDQKLLEQIYNQIIKKEPTFLILAGLHGDEPAGNLAAKYFKDFKNVWVWDSINPTSRRRFQGKDLNRHFEEEGEGEIQKSIEEQIEVLNPTVVISLHEDDEVLGMYAYCSSELKEKVCGCLKEGGIKIASSVHGDKTEEGVIISGKQPYRGTLERFLKRRGILYFTLETPSSFYPLQKRVQVMVRVLKEFLKWV